MPEIRNLPEGELRWVQASGTGGWNTASAPASGLFGYVRDGMTFQQPFRFEPYFNRGTAGGFKFVRKEQGQINFTLGYGVTADYPPTAITASGVSTPQIHLEFRAKAPEYLGLSAGSGIYWQFHNCVPLGPRVTENEREDQAQFSFQYLNQVGPTGSGYLG